MVQANLIIFLGASLMIVGMWVPQSALQLIHRERTYKSCYSGAKLPKSLLFSVSTLTVSFAQSQVFKGLRTACYKLNWSRLSQTTLTFLLLHSLTCYIVPTIFILHLDVCNLMRKNYIYWLFISDFPGSSIWCPWLLWNQLISHPSI